MQPLAHLTLQFALLVILLAQLACATSSPEDPKARVYSLIEQRLTYMPDVAAFKYEHQIPIENLEREAMVIANVVAEAAEAGLAPASVVPFFETQIAAAKLIQASVWQQLENGDQALSGYRDLETDVRPALDRIGAELISAIANVLNQGLEFKPEDLARSIDSQYLPRASYDELGEALSAIRLSSGL
ncbi:MAG: gamma subclass chorismate mutase AroQ [Pseudomonadota bacterium]